MPKKIVVFKAFIILFCFGLMAFSNYLPSEKLDAHIKALEKSGSNPIDFIIQKLKKHDLIIFDDALHNMRDPFEFYEKLIKNPKFQELRPIIFLELLPINKQKHIDEYFSAEKENISLLFPVFQDRTGYGMKSYFDFLKAVYFTNKGLPEDNKIQVRGVNTPIYWESIRDRDDLKVAEGRAPLGRDYDMYKWILDDLENFRENKKGIFLTNTHHAYKALRNKNNDLFWNTGTFFHEWHKGKTYSIRFNAPFLKVEGIISNGDDNLSSDGTNRMRYSWRRAGKGIWDAAFRKNGDKPIAISLNNTIFGNTSYLGNNTHQAAPGQTMKDVYDAVIFLKPMEDLEKTASIGDIYTPNFKKELLRRLPIMMSQNMLEKMMSDNGVNTLEGLVEVLSKPEDAVSLPQVLGLDDINSFLKEGN